MFFLDFLYYHVKLLGKKRGTAWSEGWDGYLYAIFPIAMIYLFIFLFLIEAFWGDMIQGIWRDIFYIGVPICVTIVLGIYYWRNDERIMREFAEKSENNKWLRLPSYLVLYTYHFVGLSLALLALYYLLNK